MPFVNKFLKDFNKDVYLEPAPVKCKWGCYYYEELKSGCVGSTAVSFSNNLWVIKIRNKFENAYSLCTNSFLPTSIALAPNWIGSSKKQKICNNWHKSHQQIRCRQKCKDSNEWSFAVALSKKKKRNNFFFVQEAMFEIGFDLIFLFFLTADAISFYIWLGPLWHNAMYLPILLHDWDSSSERKA